MAQMPLTRASHGFIKLGDLPTLTTASHGHLYSPIIEKFPFVQGGQLTEKQIKELLKRDPVQDWAVILMSTIN